jgi:hypothetical protein
MIELDQVYRRNPNFVFRRIEGETILVPIRGKVEDLDSIFSLNATAALAWQSLDGERSLKEVAELIAAEWDTAPGRAEADLLEFMQEMASIDAVVLHHR